MRKLVLAVAVVSLGVLYGLTPFWSALQIRSAAKSGDTALLETLVDFPQVRASLKASLAELERAKATDASVRGLPRPSLWQRVKALAAPDGIHNTLIDRYVTADGVVQMMAARGTFKAMLRQVDRRGAAAEAEAEARSGLDAANFEELSLVERMTRLVSRLKRAEFHSLSKLELEVQDRRVPERRYVGTLEFMGLGWKLTSLAVVGAGF